MIYLELLLTFMLVGALGFGGGYAVLPLIEEQLVVNHGWADNTRIYRYIDAF